MSATNLFIEGTMPLYSITIATKENWVVRGSLEKLLLSSIQHSAVILQLIVDYKHLEKYQEKNDSCSTSTSIVSS